MKNAHKNEITSLQEQIEEMKIKAEEREKDIMSQATEATRKEKEEYESRAQSEMLSLKNSVEEERDKLKKEKNHE